MKTKQGVNCYDWSSMGTGDGWFGQSAIIYLGFVRECLIANYDFIILECTSHFDTRGLSPFEHLYDILVFKFSPTLLGFAASRVRKYMMLIHKQRFRFLQQAADFGHFELFESLFGRIVKLKGIDLCRAPAEDIDDYKKMLARRRGMPECRNSGRMWSSYQVLSGSLRRMVYAHEAANSGRGNGVLCNARQHATYMSGTVHVPALLRNSLLWNVKLRRILLPTEHMEIMGMQMYGTETENCAIAEHVRTLSCKDVRSLTGNGMHTAAIGTIFMYLLSVIEPLGFEAIEDGSEE